MWRGRAAIVPAQMLRDRNGGMQRGSFFSILSNATSHHGMRKEVRSLVFYQMLPPNAEIKYWRNLNLAIHNCEAKFHCVILVCG